MRQRLNLKASFKHFVMFVAALVAFGSLFSTTAKAQTTWKITIVAKGAKKKPTYDVDPPADKSACTDGHNLYPSGRILTVCAGDKIEWRAETTEVGGQVTPGMTYLYHEDAFLLDPSTGNKFKQGFEAPNGQPIVVQVDPKAVAGEEHSYYVSVYDRLQERLYVEDPKIIIGTGNRKEAVINTIIIDAKQLAKLLQDGSDKEKARAQQLIHQADELKNLIDSQPPPK